MSLSGLSGLSGLGLSGGAGAWSPADLPGLAAWYTAGPTWCFADAGATTPCGDGDPIYTWTDQSGNGYTLTQATLAYRPILYDLGGGLWCATFDGVDDEMTVSDAALAFAAPIVAGLAETPNGTAGTVGLFGNMGRWRISRSGANARFTKPGGYDATTAGVFFSDATPAVVTVQFAGPAYDPVFRLDGGAQEAATGGSDVVASGGQICLGSSGGAIFFPGDVAGVLLANAIPSAGDLSAAENYLAALNP